MKRVLSLLIILSALSFSACRPDAVPTPAPVNPAKEELNVAYGSHPYQKMDVYFPQGYTSATPVVFLIHGGGFVAGLKEDFTMQATKFRDQNFITVNLSHRLVDTTGLLSNPPTHHLSAIKVSDELADIDGAVDRYRRMAESMGIGSDRMYMAGHSAGAILSMLYVQGDYNDDGHIRASGNWAGITDLSIPSDTFFNTLPANTREQWKELMYRATGFEATRANNLALMAISPYWVANNNSGAPNISIYPERNIIFDFPGEAQTGLTNTQNFHTLLHNHGKAEQITVYAGEDHGFGTIPGSWDRLIAETAAFFKAH